VAGIGGFVPKSAMREANLSQKARFREPQPLHTCAGRSGLGSSPSGECNDDVGGMASEVLAPVVVDRRRSRIGVTRGDLDVAQWDTCIERRHNERRSKHVWVDRPEPCSSAD
jgi:hypothetical protein